MINSSPAMHHYGLNINFRSVYLILLIGIWSVLVGFLLKRTYFGMSSVGFAISLDTGIKDIPTDSQWMTIYHQGRKLGYSIYSIQNRGDEGYHVNSTALMKTAIAGIETQFHLQDIVNIDTLFRLKSFDFRLVSEQVTTRLKGVRNGTALQVIYYSGKDSTIQTIHYPDDLYTHVGLQPMVAWRGIKAGQKITIPSFDPITMDIADVEIAHEGKEELTLGGKTYQLNKIRVLFHGIPATLWLDDNGLTYREESIMGLVLERTTPEDALQMDGAAQGIDLIDLYAIPVETRITNPRLVSKLILEIGGVERQHLKTFNSKRQRVINENPLQLQLQPLAVPAEAVLIDQYLKSSPIIPCDHPRIADLSQEISGAEITAWDKVQRLNQWVYNYLEKRPVVSFSSALEILAAKQGDCSEHTVLFTTLSRGSGIPTKIHVGVVYLGGRFLYHAWPVVYIEGKWIAVDPTLNQPIADATHIVFLEGDFTNLYELIPILGRINIQVVDQQYEYEKATKTNPES